MHTGNSNRVTSDRSDDIYILYALSKTAGKVRRELELFEREDPEGQRTRGEELLKRTVHGHRQEQREVHEEDPLHSFLDSLHLLLPGTGDRRRQTGVQEQPPSTDPLPLRRSTAGGVRADLLLARPRSAYIGHEENRK